MVTVLFGRGASSIYMAIRASRAAPIRAILRPAFVVAPDVVTADVLLAAADVDEALLLLLSLDTSALLEPAVARGKPPLTTVAVDEPVTVLKVDEAEAVPELLVLVAEADSETLLLELSSVSILMLAMVPVRSPYTYCLAPLL